MGKKYDAFISYGRQKLDKAIAEKMQKKLENFRPPRGIEYKNAKKLPVYFGTNPNCKPAMG